MEAEKKQSETMVMQMMQGNPFAPVLLRIRRRLQISSKVPVAQPSTDLDEPSGTDDRHD
jgi:hypothetical protein